MDFLRNNRCFDLLYGGESFSALAFDVAQTEGEGSRITTYTLADGLKITNILKKHGKAYEWVNWFENTGDQPTKILSELYDACISLPMPHEEPYSRTAFQASFKDWTAVYAPSGSTWDYDEFYCDVNKT